MAAQDSYIIALASNVCCVVLWVSKKTPNRVASNTSCAAQGVTRFCVFNTDKTASVNAP